jgi:TPR repeat protein
MTRINQPEMLGQPETIEANAAIDRSSLSYPRSLASFPRSARLPASARRGGRRESKSATFANQTKATKRSLFSFIVSFSFLSLFSLNVSANAEIDIYGLPSAKKINELEISVAAFDDATAAYELAVIYQNAKDYKKAIKWYEKAHKLGDKDAAYALGILYEDKLKDYERAVKWYEKAHEIGNENAAYALGLIYKKQLQDYENAKKWYEIAYNKNDEQAAYALGLLYDDIYKDYPKAIEWYEIAYNKNKFKDAAYSLGLLYYEALKDYPKAIEWLEIAHNQKDKRAAFALGILYDETIKDYKNAFKWFEITYNDGKNHYGALAKMGIAYAEGKGVKKDIAKARSLLQQALDKADIGSGASKLAKEALDAINSAKSQ